MIKKIVSRFFIAVMTLALFTMLTLAAQVESDFVSFSVAIKEMIVLAVVMFASGGIAIKLEDS